MISTATQRASAASAPQWGTQVRRRSERRPGLLVWEPRRRSLPELLQDALPWAEREFLIQGERRQTFADHAVAVDHAVIELHARGVAHGDRVLILSGNHIETIVLWWATVCVGAIPVMGNSWWSPVEINGAIGDIDPRIFVADDKRATRVPPEAGHGPPVDYFAPPGTAQNALPPSPR